MDLRKITLFLVFVTISQCEKHEGNEFIVHDADFEDTVEATDRSVSPSRLYFWHHKLENCMCLPPSYSGLGKVTNHIDPASDSPYERLVVFLYKKATTDEYKIYIPDRRRQRVFPDIDYEITDILRNDQFDFISTLFKTVFSDVRSWVNVRINRGSGKPQPPTAKPVHVTPKPDVIDKHDTELINKLVTRLPEERIRRVLNMFTETKRVFGSLIGKTLRAKLFLLRKLYPIVFKYFMRYISNFFPTWLINGNIIRYKPDHLRRFPYDIKLIKLINGKREILNGQLQSRRNVQEIIVYTPSRSTIEELYPEIYTNTNLSFDRWFKIVVEGLNVQLNFASKVVDQASLKTFVLDVLQKQNISMDLHGHLKNSYALRIPLSDLILRPILIGESDLINRVIDEGLFKTPSGIVFVEALLKSGSTVETLGIIPMSHILGGNREEIITDTTTVELVETETVCENGVCKSKKICKNVQGEEEPCNFTNLDSKTAAPDEEDGSEAPLDDMPHSVCKHKKHCKNCKHKHCEENNTEPSVIVEEPIADVSISHPLIILDKSGNAISPTEKLPDNDEELDIRIIGGNAATNSGTPVSSKGRSGY